MKKPVLRVEPRNLYFDLYPYRVRFAFFPVRRWASVRSLGAINRGWYWWRIVVEIKSGWYDEWTAYAHYNDNLQTSNI